MVLLPLKNSMGLPLSLSTIGLWSPIAFRDCMERFGCHVPCCSFVEQFSSSEARMKVRDKFHHEVPLGHTSDTIKTCS